jgi:HPr kinase/phosphorylase
MTQPTVHATAIVIGAAGVLIRGAPGSGKSSLALQLIDQPGYGLGARAVRAKLIADDQVRIEKRHDMIVMSAPHALKNRIEIRGLGIRPIAAITSAKLHLVVDLAPFAEIERMPERHQLQCEILGITIPRIAVNAADSAASARIRATLFHRVAKADGGA